MNTDVALTTQDVALSAPTEIAGLPTIWGLNPIELHDYFWAARGVCVVRLGEERGIPRDAELFLLTDARTLTLFRLMPLLDTLSWIRPSVLFLRLANKQEQGYREVVMTAGQGQFLRFRRLYGGVLPQLARAAITRDAAIAAAWQRASDPVGAWRSLRQESRAAIRESASIAGRAYDRTSDDDVSKFITDLVNSWGSPAATVAAVSEVSPRIWAFNGVKTDATVRFIGPAWIGAGRSVEPNSTVLGPTVLWDDPTARPPAPSIRWSELEPIRPPATSSRNGPASNLPHGHNLPGKRLFDIVLSCVALLVTLPLYPLIMLAIWLEDGRPFFFAHRRETLGGREFPCIKFRSMRKNAERDKSEVASANKADGPQFYVPQDPRQTRVGRFLRKTNLDEVPQFINVLLGHMSIVGPRPSPRSENQFNPAWREARLSVRAGVTGLWQVRRTRRPGLDFQEWIKYDLEYVQNASWLLDLRILVRTISFLLWG